MSKINDIDDISPEMKIRRILQNFVLLAYECKVYPPPKIKYPDGAYRNPPEPNIARGFYVKNKTMIKFGFIEFPKRTNSQKSKLPAEMYANTVRHWPLRDILSETQAMLNKSLDSLRAAGWRFPPGWPDCLSWTSIDDAERAISQLDENRPIITAPPAVPLPDFDAGQLPAANATSANTTSNNQTPRAKKQYSQGPTYEEFISRCNSFIEQLTPHLAEQVFIHNNTFKKYEWIISRLKDLAKYAISIVDFDSYDEIANEWIAASKIEFSTRFHPPGSTVESIRAEKGREWKLVNIVSVLRDSINRKRIPAELYDFITIPPTSESLIGRCRKAIVVLTPLLSPPSDSERKIVWHDYVTQSGVQKFWPIMEWIDEIAKAALSLDDTISYREIHALVAKIPKDQWPWGEIIAALKDCIARHVAASPEESPAFTSPAAVANTSAGIGGDAATESATPQAPVAAPSLAPNWSKPCSKSEAAAYIGISVDKIDARIKKNQSCVEKITRQTWRFDKNDPLFQKLQ